MKTAALINSKKSHVDSVRELAFQQMLEVCKYLGWTEEQYCTHQLNEYEAFLKRMFQGFPEEMLNEVRYSPLMSGFWKNEWNDRNRCEFLPLAIEDLTPSMWIDSYGKLDVHEPNEWNERQVFDEYLWIHSYRNLIYQDYFMDQYNYVLKLIRQSKTTK